MGMATQLVRECIRFAAADNPSRTLSADTFGTNDGYIRFSLQIIDILPALHSKTYRNR